MRTFFVRLSAIVAAIVFGAAMQSHAGGVKSKLAAGMSPQEYSDFRYRSQPSRDWSRSDRFDFENPVSIRVVVHRLVINDGGYAELLYRRADEPAVRRPANIDPSIPVSTFRRATLQSADQWKSLDVNAGEIKAGAHLMLSGWPATRLQSRFSEMLVDEISFSASGRTVTLHDPDPCMVKYREKDLPRESRELRMNDADGPACPKPFDAGLGASAFSVSP